MTDSHYIDTEASPLADHAERRAIFAVLDSFRQYRRQTHFSSTHRRRQNFYALSQTHQNLLNRPPINYLDTLSTIDDAIDANADLADAILRQTLQSLSLPEQPESGSPLDWHEVAKAEDLNKAHSTIKQFYRDWSLEGFEKEVKPVLQTVLGDLKSTINHAEGVNVLLPGAGLGRLLFELCRAGYNTEGNEISYHQLFASDLVLNHLQHAGQFSIYPFVTTFTNKLSRSDQLRCVTIPDLHPETVINDHRQRVQQSRGNMCSPGSMSMSAGDFITSYSTMEAAGTFDAVVSVYFIDTAPNLIKYIETVRHCLTQNGIWINIGPLLWHFEDRIVKQPGQSIHRDADTDMDGEDKGQARASGIAEPGSFELSNEEVLCLIGSMGFEIVKQEILDAHYGCYVEDPCSMLQSRYRSSHWVARKKMEG